VFVLELALKSHIATARTNSDGLARLPLKQPNGAFAQPDEPCSNTTRTNLTQEVKFAASSS
jgi:hypothetical protein